MLLNALLFAAMLASPVGAASLARTLQPTELATTELNLLNTTLKPCTQSSDTASTGIDRTGSCSWDESDTGYHQVCVTMTSEFLKNSAADDGNDLSSVVAAGGHWCICAWAWASAVQRDPTNKEGLALDCERTNGRLRSVYQTNAKLSGPTGNSYESTDALAAVEAICG